MSIYDKLTVLYVQALAVTGWTASATKSLASLVKPVTENGYFYECTTAGVTDSAEPTWPAVPGGTVADGTAVWTCRAVAAACVAVSRQSDGGIMFHDSDAGGNKVVAHANPELKKLFDSLSDLT